MNSDKFKEIKNAKKRKLYEAMWDGNTIINSAQIEKSVAGKKKTSDNSFSFAGDKKSSLISIFNIPEEKRGIFSEKFNMICSGSGQEYGKITTIHSSSLCALLFFYNVTDNNPLKIDGIGSFTKSVFEFKSPVIDKGHCANIDVVLTGKNDSGEDIVLFIESKFSEYFSDVSRKLKIPERYLKNEYSSEIYDSEFLNLLGLSKSDIEDGFFELSADSELYIGGIKQMISHYVGIRNMLNNDFAKQKEKEQEAVADIIRAGAKVYLAEIFFDKVIGDFTLSDGKSCKDSYSEKYEILAKKMNDCIAKSEIQNRFEVFPRELGYSLFLDEKQEYNLDDNIKLFYFDR